MEQLLGLQTLACLGLELVCLAPRQQGDMLFSGAAEPTSKRPKPALMKKASHQ